MDCFRTSFSRVLTLHCLRSISVRIKFSAANTGRVLTQHSENVYGAERPFAWLGIDVNGRGAVVKLSDGSLWVHSPVKLDPELRAAMDALGPVKHIVTPNFEHNKFAQQVIVQHLYWQQYLIHNFLAVHISWPLCFPAQLQKQSVQCSLSCLQAVVKLACICAS